MTLKLFHKEEFDTIIAKMNSFEQLSKKENVRGWQYLPYTLHPVIPGVRPAGKVVSRFCWLAYQAFYCLPGYNKEKEWRTLSNGCISHA